MMNRNLISLLFGLFLVACTTADRVVKLYEASDFEGGPFSNVLVVGAHEDSGTRRRFEDSVVNSLRASGTQAMSSIAIMGADVEINRETLLAAVGEADSDAVLITRLQDVQTRTQVEGGRVGAEAQRRNNIPLADFFRYDYVEYEDPMTITRVHTVVLATDLYNVADEAKIWSIESTSFDKQSVYGVIDSASAAISSQLTRDGLIQ